MATYLTSNIYSDIYVGGNCVVKGTMTVSGGGGTTQWTTSGTSIYYTTGNVGIGTATAPAYPLDVYGAGRFLGSAGTATWSVAATTGSGTSSRVADVSFYSTFFNFPGDVGQRRTADITAGFSAGTWGGEYMAFGVGNGGAPNDAQTVTLEKMRITGAGNVGILTNAPSYPLHVVGDINFTGSLRQNGTVYAPSSQWTGAGGSPIYYVPFVGIGSTLTPAANLMVTGNVFVSNAIQTTNIVAAGFTSNATTTTFTCDTMSMPFVNATQVTATSSVGIGTTLPTQALDVYGSMNCATVSSSTGLMFRNRLYNGNFQIWQRNTTFTGIGTNTYTADRWVTPINAGAGSTLTVSRQTNVPSGRGFNYSLQIVTAATTGAPSLIEQRIEAVNTADLVNGTYVTVSFWAIQTSPATFITLNTQLLYPTVADTFSSVSSIGIVGNVLTGSWAYYTATILVNTASVATNGMSVQFWAASITAATTILIAGVQLEKGTVATPYEFRPYPIELQLCYRYYYQITALTSGGNPQSRINWGIAYVRSSGNASIYYSLPVPMRVQPTFFNNTALQFDWDGVANLNAFNSPVLNTTKSSNKDIEIDGTVTGGTQGQAGAIILQNPSVGQYASFSAEL